MNLNDTTERVNALVRQWIVKQYRDNGTNQHLRECPDTWAGELDGYDSVYGCDTGCEYVRFEAVITCPHGEHDDDYEYGEFDDLASIIEDIERDAAR